MIEELLEAMSKGHGEEECEEEEMDTIKDKAILNEMEEFIGYVHEKNAKDASASLCTLFELLRGY